MKSCMAAFAVLARAAIQSTYCGNSSYTVMKRLPLWVFPHDTRLFPQLSRACAVRASWFSGWFSGVRRIGFVDAMAVAGILVEVLVGGEAGKTWHWSASSPLPPVPKSDPIGRHDLAASFQARLWSFVENDCPEESLTILRSDLSERSPAPEDSAASWHGVRKSLGLEPWSRSGWRGWSRASGETPSPPLPSIWSASSHLVASAWSELSPMSKPGGGEIALVTVTAVQFSALRTTSVESMQSSAILITYKPFSLSFRLSLRLILVRKHRLVHKSIMAPRAFKACMEIKNGVALGTTSMTIQILRFPDMIGIRTCLKL